MTNVQLLNTVVRIQETAKRDDIFGVRIELENLIKELTLTLGAEKAKVSGDSVVFKAAMRILKSAERNANAPFHGAFMYKDSCGDKYQCVCDGYQLVRFKTQLDLPKAPVPNTLDIEGIYKGLSRETPLESPTVPELRTMLKVHKAKYIGRPREYKAMYDFGEGKPLVDANFLLNILECLPGCTMYSNGEKGYIPCVAENGDGLLLPILRRADVTRWIVNGHTEW